MAVSSGVVGIAGTSEPSTGFSTSARRFRRRCREPVAGGDVSGCRSPAEGAAVREE
jgi:hypothetical protein